MKMVFFVILKIFGTCTYKYPGGKLSLISGIYPLLSYAKQIYS